MKKFFSSPGRIIACIVCTAVILILAGGLGAYAALSLTGAIAPKGNEVVLAETSATEEAASAAEAESDLLEEESSVPETGTYASETESDASVTENDTSEAASTRISLDEAKAIALGQAGLSASEVTFVKAKMEKDDGALVYEIEFFQGQMEYECTIDALTGEILEYEEEWDD